MANRGELVALVGESGCGKTLTGPFAAAPPSARRRDRSHECDPVRRDRPHDARRERAEAVSRPPYRHGVPGSDDVAQSGDARRQADHGGDPGAPRRIERGCAQSCNRVARRGRHCGSPRARRFVSASTERWHASARDDRDGIGWRAGLARSRRAHHGARRDRAGADSRAARPVAHQPRPRRPAHHARPRHRRGTRRPRAGDVCGANRRILPNERTVRASRASVHEGIVRVDSAPRRDEHTTVADSRLGAAPRSMAVRMPLPSALSGRGGQAARSCGLGST